MQTTFDEFHNALRILTGIDHAEVKHFMDIVDYRKFSDNPWLWMIKAPDAKAKAIWKIIVERQPHDPPRSTKT